MEKEDLSLEELCGNIASKFRQHHWENDLDRITSILEDTISDMDEEEEWHSYIKEIHELFDICLRYPQFEKPVKRFISGLSWENFFDDETGKPYSLGSMYFNKLTWIIEGSDDEEATELAKKLIDVLPPFLDAIEISSK